MFYGKGRYTIADVQRGCFYLVKAGRNCVGKKYVVRAHVNRVARVKRPPKAHSTI